jgi:hypothetical protein
MTVIKLDHEIAPFDRLRALGARLDLSIRPCERTPAAGHTGPK